jgi:hypothetical protein
LYAEELLLPEYCIAFPSATTRNKCDAESSGTHRRRQTFKGLKVKITTIGLHNVEDYLNPRDRDFEPYWQKRGRFHLNYKPDFNALLKATVRRFDSLGSDLVTNVLFDCRKMRDPEATPGEDIRQHLGYHPVILRQCATHPEMRALVKDVMDFVVDRWQRGEDYAELSLIFICHSRHRSVAVGWMFMCLLKEIGAKTHFLISNNPPTRGCQGKYAACRHLEVADQNRVFETMEIVEGYWDAMAAEVTHYDDEHVEEDVEDLGDADDARKNGNQRGVVHFRGYA